MNLNNETQFCECCEAEIKPGRAVWLELNMNTGRYSDPKKTIVPAEESQGVFPFGRTCARKVLNPQTERKL